MLSSTELIAAFDEAEERLGGEKATPLNMYCEGFFKGVEVGKADLTAKASEWLEGHLMGYLVERCGVTVFDGRLWEDFKKVMERIDGLKICGKAENH
jgi:hypothetical protein